MGRVTRRHAVLRVSPGEAIRRSDTLAVEEPLEIRLNGESYLVTMRTPGGEEELAAGFLVTEGLCGPHDIEHFTIGDNVLEAIVAPVWSLEQYLPNVAFRI